MDKRRDQRHKRVDRTTVKDNRRKLSEPSGQSLKFRRYTIWTTSVLLAVVTMAGTWMILRVEPPVKLASATNPPATILPADSSKSISSDSVSSSPKISFPETEYNFGTIAQGSKVSHTFVVRNVGDAPLRLIKAAGS
jgi:hypothetical protein